MFELPPVRRFLKGSTTVPSSVDDSTTKLKVEERMSVPSIFSINRWKDKLQKAVALVRDRATTQKTRIAEFLAQNPAIKKELIVATVLISLIVAVPPLVKSFYPA
ncbi:unnamed protein product [Peronospora belbahrii]|uniref:Uncharacterized protein n=1 Tax=Peronospora belbahrii TaxID=622444 RepID=A0AAU9LBB3_9STRA|nr:unnamed protein product [Peronospora belbahrii]